MVLAAVDLWGWEDLVLWKTDLAGAFHLVDIRAEDVRLMAYELTGGLTLLYTRGMFGWQGSPFMFAVISRVLERLVCSRISGSMRMYVDDMMGVSRRTSAESDIRIAGECARDLLGPDSVAEDKTESGRALDFLGWRVDLDSRRVSIARHNVTKTFHSFMSVDLTGGRIGFKHAEKLASYASRYAEVIRFLRPFGACFFEQKKRSARANSQAVMSAPMSWAVRFWQLHLAVMQLRGSVYCVKMESFRRRAPRVVVEFDASLTATGILISEVLDDGTLHVRKAAALTFPFQLGEDSSFQNSAEFLSLVVAFVLIVRLGSAGAPVEIRGDSVSALTWAFKERFRAGRSLRATIAYVAIGSRYDLEVCDAVHVAGLDNVVCDRLSRGVTPTELGFGADTLLSSEEWLLSMAALELCDPTVSCDDIGELAPFYGRVDQLSESLGTAGAGGPNLAPFLSVQSERYSNGVQSCSSHLDQADGGGRGGFIR
jgi:hypothetical protein